MGMCNGRGSIAHEHSFDLVGVAIAKQDVALGATVLQTALYRLTY